MIFQDFTEPSGRFYNADCFDVMKELPDGCVDMILCDLPYGTTACKWDSVIPFELLWEQYERIIKDNGAIVLFSAQPFTSALVMSNPELFRYDWLWEKNSPTGFPNANYMPLRSVESMLVFSKAIPNPNAKSKMIYFPQDVIPNKRIKTRNSKKGTINGGENDGSLNKQHTSYFSNYPRQVLRFDSESKTIHPTQKPVALFEYLIKTYTNEFDLVLDNCAGSGTTAVACKNLKRRWVCIEKEAEYYEKAILRL